MRALVIDDSKAMRAWMTSLLNEMGFEVFEACHGLQALERLTKNGKVDLMLLDINMPEMDGFKFLRLVRSQHLQDSALILMVTSENGLDKVDAALKAGANEYIMKPFSKEALHEKLRLAGILTAQ
ncbi:MAG TPA: response regulator [Nitrospiria bacterium]|nr:response regulator [Nitrospiria bacterium]